MSSLNYILARDTARQCISRQKAKPWIVSLIYALLTQGIFLGSSYLQSYFAASFLQAETVEELLQLLLTEGGSILRILAVIAGTGLLGAISYGAYVCYATAIAKGTPATAGTFFRSFSLTPKVLLLVILLLLLFCAVSIPASLALVLLPTAAGIVVYTVLLVCCAVPLFYSLRLVFYVIADRRELSVPAAMKECMKLSKGRKKQIFYFDLNCLWFLLLVEIVSSLCYSLGKAVYRRLAASGLAIAAALTSNMTLFCLFFDLLGVLAVAALYAWKLHQIQVSYCCAYQQLKASRPLEESTHPLAYEEYPQNRTDQP